MPAGLDHVVLFKLNVKSGSDSEKNFFDKANAWLSTIPGVVSVSAGSQMLCSRTLTAFTT